MKLCIFLFIGLALGGRQHGHSSHGGRGHGQHGNGHSSHGGRGHGGHGSGHGHGSVTCVNGTNATYPCPICKDPGQPCLSTYRCPDGECCCTPTEEPCVTPPGQCDIGFPTCLPSDAVCINPCESDTCPGTDKCCCDICPIDTTPTCYNSSTSDTCDYTQCPNHILEELCEFGMDCCCEPEPALICSEGGYPICSSSSSGNKCADGIQSCGFECGRSGETCYCEVCPKGAKTECGGTCDEHRCDTATPGGSEVCSGGGCCCVADCDLSDCSDLSQFPSCANNWVDCSYDHCNDDEKCCCTINMR